MTDDRTSNPDTEPGEMPPGSRRRTARELYKELDGPVDEQFKKSLAGLSSRLGERSARQSPKDAQAAAEARRAALKEYDIARARRLKSALHLTGAAVATACVACLTVFIAMSPEQSASRVEASVQRAPPIEVAVAPTPTPTPTPPMRPMMAAEAAPAVAEPAPVRLAALEVPTVVPITDPLQRDEVREVQTRLHRFGFNAGPVDGAAGPMTRAAIMHYQQKRGLLQTGTVDRELLDQLRQDPAPQVAMRRVTQPAARPSRAARQPDPFEPLRVAAEDFERWLQSLGR